MNTVGDVLEQLSFESSEAAEPFFLKVGSVSLSVRCPSPLREELQDYFSAALSDQAGQTTVHLLPGQTLSTEPDWTDWQREPGKAGQKDAIYELSDGRLIRKVRSGVTFLQAPEAVVAIGSLDQNASTVINFINTQILNAYLRAGWQLCHAAAVTRGDRTLAISGLSGGGKSTSMLQLMDIEDMRFVSNDRILVKAGNPPQALGIPKHPRINPGTILGNSKLADMLSDARRAELEALPADALWQLEDKHDVMIDKVYGPGRIQFQAGLTDFWVLNWSRDSETATLVSDVDLKTRPDLIAAIVKSPGPFYQHADGRFEPNGASVETVPYLDILQNVSVKEVTGRLDFAAITQFGRTLFDA